MNRGGLLGLVLFATLIAAGFAPSKEDDGVLLSEQAAQRAAGRGGDATRDASARSLPPEANRTIAPGVEVLGIRERDTEAGDQQRSTRLFASTRWTPPPPKVTPSAAPMATAPVSPRLPPPPFRVFGRYEEAGQASVFLQHLEQNLVVRVGETIADHYKVESLNDTTLTLRYLPQNQVQTLPVSGVQ